MGNNMGDPTKINRDLKELDPDFREKILLVVEQANRETVGKFPKFKEWRIFEGYRSQARQDWLYAQGRTRPGNIVTNAKKSYHTMRHAADIIWYDTSGQPHWDGAAKLWAILGHAARTQGLHWGGDWKMKDLPHVEMR